MKSDRRECRIAKLSMVFLALCLITSCSKPLPPEQRQFISSLDTFHSMVSSLSSAYDAAAELKSLARGLQNNSPSLMNMQGSEFIRKSDSLTSAVGGLSSAKEQTRATFAQLASDYAVLQSKNEVLPGVRRFFSGVALSDQSWIENEETVKRIRDESQNLLEQMPQTSPTDSATVIR